MGLNASGFDADGIMKSVMDAAVNQLAQATADAALEKGVSTVEEARSVKFDLSSDTDGLDLAEVEARARRIMIDRLS